MDGTARVPIARHAPPGKSSVAILAAAILAIAFAANPVAAESGVDGGKDVVDRVCITCHGTGANGAPKIGDKKAWSKRAAQGLTSLTQNALSGIRQMPPHGGNPGLTDFEIEEAITYMVNKSGGHWTAPINRARPLAERSGEQVVTLQCITCHDAGVGGAPRIGDRAAWIPRLTQGLDPLVRSAINGHGGMPPRGGMANLTDNELRRAVVFMLNGGTAPAKPSTVTASGPNFKVVEGMTVYLGVVSADRIRENPKEFPTNVYGVAPSLPEQYYVTVSLFDANDGKRVADAGVRARVSTAAGAGPEKALERTAVPGSPTYGNYFAMAGTGPYEITLHITRSGRADTLLARFEYNR